MGNINAYRDSSEPNLVHIVPSGFQPGETSNVDVKIRLTGYDESTLSFTAQDTIAVSPQLPVETDVSSLNGYTNEEQTITVTTSGTFTAVSSNSNVSLILDQSGRTIKTSISAQQQLSRQEGNITISMDGYLDKVIPFTLEAIEDITINGAPSGQEQFVNEPITLTVVGATREVNAVSSDPNVDVVKNSPYEFTVTARQEASNVEITVSGRGVKTRSKRYNFSAQETAIFTFTPDAPFYVGDSSKLVVSGISSFTGLNVSSNNPDVVINPVPDEDGAYLVEFNEVGRATITATKRGMVTKTQEVSSLDLLTLVPSIPSVNGTVGNDVRVTISGAQGAIQASSDNSDISVRVEGNDIIISAATEQTGNITVTSDNAHDLVISVNIASLPNIDYEISATPGTLYIGEPYRLTVNGSLSNVRCTSSEPRVTVTKLEESNNVFSIVTHPTSGTTEVFSDITISADGMSDTVVRVSFLELMVITATADHNSVPYDIPITLTLSNGKPGMTVVADSENVSATLISDEGVYKVVCVAQLETDTDILINGRGILPYQFAISFTNKDQLTYTATPAYSSYYVGEDVEISVTGTTRDIEFTIDDGPGDNATLREKTPQDKYTRILSATSECIVRVGIRGQGCNSISIPNIEFNNPVTPSCSLSKPTNLFIGDTTRLTIGSVKGTYRVEASDPKIIISKIEEGIYDVTATQPVSGTINIIGERGVNNTSVSVEFQDDQTPSVSVTTSETTYDTSISLTVSGVTENYTVTTDVDGININKVSEGSYNITATKPCSGDIVVSGDNVKEHRETIRFIDKDTLSITINPNTPTHFLRENVTITVNGTTKPYSITAKNKETNAPVPLNNDRDNVYSLTSETDITVEVTVTGIGIHSKVFDIVYLADEVPECRLALNGDVIDYMYSNETVILIIDNVTRNINVTGDNIVTVNKNSEGLYEVTASSSGVGNITISGQGVTETIVPITVKNTYEVRYEMEPSNGISYVNKPITVRSIVDEEISITAKPGSEFLDIQNQ